jgi:hypothetical protein
MTQESRYEITEMRDLLNRMDELVSRKAFFQYRVPDEHVDEPGEYLIGYQPVEFFEQEDPVTKIPQKMVRRLYLYEYGTTNTFPDRLDRFLSILKSDIENRRVYGARLTSGER